MTNYSEILYEVEDGIATVRLNRPTARNALTTTMFTELGSALGEMDSDDKVRAAIVTGSGRTFCAGADLSRGRGSTFDLRGRSENGSIPRDRVGLLTLKIFDSRKPIIAAINGDAVGGGLTMTLPMDVRLATRETRFGLVFTRRGIVPEGASTWFLPRLVGISRSAEWLYSGRVFSADEALSAGLIRSVHDPDDLLPAARDLAAEFITSTSPVSVALSRQMLWRMSGARHPMEAHEADSRGVYYTGQSADAAEGVASFLEKRSPLFGSKVSSDLPDLFPSWREPEFQ